MGHRKQKYLGGSRRGKRLGFRGPEIKEPPLSALLKAKHQG